jgi:hypothetical protein
MRERLVALQAIKAQLEALPDHQLSMTDPDARAKTTDSMKVKALVGYNVQTAVNVEHHLVGPAKFIRAPRLAGNSDVAHRSAHDRR